MPDWESERFGSVSNGHQHRHYIRRNHRVQVTSTVLTACTVSGPQDGGELRRKFGRANSRGSDRIMRREGGRFQAHLR